MIYLFHFGGGIAAGGEVKLIGLVGELGDSSQIDRNKVIDDAAALRCGRIFYARIGQMNMCACSCGGCRGKEQDQKKVLFCAADTFRAAAAEQLTIWADRAGVDIVKQHEGADPAAVVFDAMNAARARRVDVVLVDTAGRLHNKQNLMNELNKIRRVIDREGEKSSKEVLLVLDATTGQNGLIQAKQFGESAGITGIVLTKLDGTAKGGVVVAIAKEMGVPVKFVGLGEGIDDLQPFDPVAFVNALI